jgi:hypothetical protein
MSFNTVLHGSGNDRYYGRPGRYGFVGATEADEDNGKADAEAKVGDDNQVEDENEDYEDGEEDEDESFYCAVCFDFGHDATECDVENKAEPPRHFRCSNCDGYDHTAYECPSSEVDFEYKSNTAVCYKASRFSRSRGHVSDASVKVKTFN